MLVLLKYPDPFIEYASFESCLSCCFLAWAQNFSTIQCIVNFHTSPYSSMALELQVCSYRLNVGQDQLNIALIMYTLTK